jgi:site-specific recombinase XerD
MGKKRASKSRPPSLTEEQVDALIRAASRSGRYGHRDATMIRVGFRHGFRVSELCGLRKDQVDLDRKIVHVRRLKGGTPATHDMTGQEVRDIRRVLRESKDPRSDYVFVTERKTKMSPRTFHDIMERAGEQAGIRLKCNPHTLRHACGSAMANRGIDTRAIQAWLGHTNITMTVLYTQLAADRLSGLW